jgi:subtilisin family serine protease
MHAAPPVLDNPPLDEVKGAVLSRRTLEYLRRREEERPDVVHSAIVYFRDDYETDQLRFLLTAGRSRANREERWRLAQENAGRMQAGVRHFLTTAEARDCFPGRPDFLFEPHRHVHPFAATNTLVTPATARLVEALADQENVLAVQRNLRLRPVAGEQLVPLTQIAALAGPGWEAGHDDGYTWGWKRLGLRDIHRAGYTGKVTEEERIILGAADTGVCEDHPDLVFKVKDFMVAEPTGRVAPAHSFDTGSHGTHCAGTLVGANNSGTQIGGAPDAYLKVAAVLDGKQGRVSSLLDALDWFVALERGVNVLNLSLGVERPAPDDAAALEMVCEHLDRMGLVCVAAIGNRPNQSMYPARLEKVLGCGAFGPDGEVWENSGARPDLVLPGAFVFSSVPAVPERGYRSWAWRQGTSCAAAHLSALVGLLWQACPKATPALIRKALTETAGNPTYDARSGWGVPDFWKARDFLEQRC